MESLNSSVGIGVSNKKEDVMLIQRLINAKNCAPSFTDKLRVDGDCGNKTIAVIKKIQAFIKISPDGVVGPNGPTFRYLRTFFTLGTVGVGYKIYGADSNQADKVYGTEGTIVAIQAVARLFQDAQSDIEEDKRALLQIGDISYSDGKVMSPHVSHRRGIDVDIRPIRKDSKNLPVSIGDPQYDQKRTKAVVEIIKKYTLTSSILFNDTAIAGVTYASGHHNHLHVRFKL